ncbi:unnamed protein product [Chironomus riparius]|uniref:Ionotropic receptor n=1 Tax=Chironomus riparius TaxID=315576 RepID=A0A9N9WW61_9DIPT|nr:unnamed protein product [Chironomus riparius]
MNFITSNLFSPVWHHMAKIICVVPASTTLIQRLKVLEIFTNSGFLDFTVVHKTEFNDILYEISGSMTRNVKSFLNPTDARVIFPDKLVDMKGFTYKIVSYHQPPFVQIKSNQVISHMALYIQALCQAQNSNYQVDFLANPAHVSNYWIERRMHLTINTATKVDSPLPKLINYEKKSYCALVPVPPKSSFFQLIIVKPFDALTWMLFLLSVISAVFVWRIYYGRGAVDSHWQLAAGIFMIFIGQDAGFSRQNRFVLAVLLNIICLSVFLLSTFYESAITSFMIEPGHENRLRTVDDLLASKYKIMVSKAFEFIVENDKRFQSVKSRTNSSGFLISSNDESNLIQNDYIFVKICETAENLLTKRFTNGRLLSDYYYLLPEELIWQYVELEASYLNPFLERFQYYMDLCFQGGLQQMWKVFASQNYAYKSIIKSDEIKSYLEFEDLRAVFAVYSILCTVSIVVVLFEIFYDDFLRFIRMSKILNSSFSTKFHFKTLIDVKKLSNSICKVANDLINLKTHTQDILIGNLGRKSWSQTINDIAKCIGDGNAMVISDLKQQITEMKLRKATLVILTFDYFNGQQIRSIAVDHHFSTVWHHMAKIIIIVPSSTTFASRSFILSAFKGLGFIDIAVVHVTTENEVRSEFQFNLLLDNMAVHYNPENASQMFYDKLKNMHGYKYFIPITEQPPFIEFFPTLKNSPMVYFLDALKKIQNSNYHLHFLKDQVDLKNTFVRRDMTLTLNYGYIGAIEPRLQTYEQIGFCALIPLPLKTSLSQLIFIEPFDGLTWMFFAISVLGSVGVWKLFRGHGAVESPWIFVYGMFVYFIGQGIDFSRRNRTVLTVLIQLIILMIFVLSNAYEGVITSFMIQPPFENRLKTVDDFIKSDFYILTDETFAMKSKDDEKLAKISSRLNFSHNELYYDDIKEARLAIVRFCDVLEMDYYDAFEDGERISDSYYILPEKLFTYYIELDASFANPFLQRFQYYMDLCFQAGLPHIWKIFADKEHYGNQQTTDREILELRDLKIMFGILLGGCGLAGVVLFIESTVWHHMAKVICIVPSHLTLDEQMDILDSFFNFGFYNVVVVDITKTEKILYAIKKSHDEIKLLTNPRIASTVFPDNLKNLDGYKYRIPIYHQPPKIQIYPNYNRPAMEYFFCAIQSIQNAQYEIIWLPKMTDLEKFWQRRQMDLTFNTASYFVTSEPKLFTYETKGYCAMVPIPPKVPLYYQIFIKPLDGLTWILFGVSIVSSVAVWRLYRGRGAVDSHWQLAAGIFMIFIGQCADFSRRNRFILAVLLNIICMSVFLLSNLYEGAVTSFMIEPAHENRLKTVDDLLASNLQISFDSGFTYLVRDDKRYQAIKSRVKMLSALFAKRLGEEIILQNYVFVRSCDLLETDLAFPLRNGQHVSDYYYMLPEKLTWHYIQLEASYLNPFLERLQYFMDLSFQAGLPHMWTVFADQNRFKASNIGLTEGSNYLVLKDLGPVFAILLIGLILSLLCLLIEIFHHDCIRFFSICNILRRVKTWVSKKFIKAQKGTLVVRQIKVQPIQST